MAEGSPTPTFAKIGHDRERERQAAEQRGGFALQYGYSYNDVLLKPGHSQVESTSQVDLSSELVPGITLRLPIVSANMDSVTEAPMAIFMAQEGGIGILHRAMTIEEQVRQIHEVKNATRLVEENPPRLLPTDTVDVARKLMESQQRGYVLVMDGEGQLQGLVTTRDVHKLAPGQSALSTVMTPREKLITGFPGISMAEAQQRMYNGRVEKLPLLNDAGQIVGVITSHDIKYQESHPLATKDEKGHLRVGVAVGTEEGLDRIDAVIAAGADVIVVDVLHGDSPRVEEIIRSIKTKYPDVPLVAGNVADGDSVRRLAAAGADAIKVGYGPGAVCTTRIETGTGAAQFTAIVEAATAAYEILQETGRKVTIIADGGIEQPGHVALALAAGADTVMIGTLLAGTDESPGDITIDEFGQMTKTVVGMASVKAHRRLAQVRGVAPKERSPQGTTASVVYTGGAISTIKRFLDGVRHGVANVGAKDILGLQQIARFELQTASAQRESRPHGRERRQS